MKLKKALILLLCFCLALSLLSCSSNRENDENSSSASQSAPDQEPIQDEKPEFPVEVNGTIVASRPVGVVSLSPAITDKIFDLKLEERLVGVSDLPEGEYPGYSLCGTDVLPDIEKIGLLKAHLVVSETALPNEYVDALLAMNIDVVVIPHAESLQELWDSYIALCRMFEGEYAGRQMGEEFVGAVSNWLNEVRTEVASLNVPPKPALYLRHVPPDLPDAISNNSIIAATRDTLEHDLMEIIGVENIAANYEGWEYPLAEAQGDGRADFVALQVMYFDNITVSMKQHLEKSAFFRGLNATLKDAFYEVDYMLMERQSMKTFEELLHMAEYTWPDANFPAWPPNIRYTLLDNFAPDNSVTEQPVDINEAQPEPVSTN